MGHMLTGTGAIPSMYFVVLFTDEQETEAVIVDASEISGLCRVSESDMSR
jgi:hypothetical protein